MTESQYRRSNRTVLALIVVILVYFVMVMGAGLLRWMRIWVRI